MDWNTLGILITAVIVPIVSGVIVIFNKISGLQKTIYDVKDKILDKLEYHEKHDDTRFDEIKKDNWLIRLRIAAMDGRVNGTYSKDQSRNVRRETVSSGESGI